jgi:DNA-binding CsgD family transcriptional regulator
MELGNGRRELEEMNAALKVLLKQREEDKVNMEMNIISNIKTSVLPYIEKLELSGLADGQMRVSSMIKSLLGEITSPFIRKVSSEFLGFTPNEIQVASLVKEGKSSKEIAEILNISPNTVHTYRYKIRIKTGLKNNKVNLRSYLQTLG